MRKQLEKCEECGQPMYLAHGHILTCMDEDCPTNEWAEDCDVCDTPSLQDVGIELGSYES